MNLAPRDCATCGESHCAMHLMLGSDAAPPDRVSYVVDEAWPEFASVVAAQLRPGDQLLAPGLLGRWPVHYRWGPAARYPAPLATALRQLALVRREMRTPQPNLPQDRRLAQVLARHIDHRARHLVVAQTWLPWLGPTGVLGGRSFDVLMHRHPLSALCCADKALAQSEAALLLLARHVITPDQEVGALFPGRAVLLARHGAECRDR